MREMGKLLATLIESAQAEKEKRAKAQAPKPMRAVRPPSADTKKNRMALFTAIDALDEERLSGLIELGVPLDGERYEIPLLVACATVKWEEGFAMLLKAGAPTTWNPERSQDAKYGGWVGYSWDLATSLFEGSCATGFAFGADALWDTATPDEIKKGIKLVDSYECWELLDRRGVASLMDRKHIVAIADWTLGNSKSPDGEERTHFEHIFKATNWSVAEKNTLWLTALFADRPELTQFAARLGLPPHPDGSVEASPEMLFDHHRFHFPKTYRPWFLVDGKVTEDAYKIRSFTLSEIICANPSQTGSNLRLLLEFPEFVKQISESPFALHGIVQSDPSPDLCSILKERGIDLSILVDCDGRNPLHTNIRSSGSKNRSEALAKLCEPWIHQCDREGHTPIAYASASHASVDEQSKLAAALDKIGMREALGGKRGTKAKSPSRRL